MCTCTDGVGYVFSEHSGGRQHQRQRVLRGDRQAAPQSSRTLNASPPASSFSSNSPGVQGLCGDVVQVAPPRRTPCHPRSGDYSNSVGRRLSGRRSPPLSGGNRRQRELWTPEPHHRRRQSARPMREGVVPESVADWGQGGAR